MIDSFFISYTSQLCRFSNNLIIVQEPATEVFTPFLTKRLPLRNIADNMQTQKGFVSWVNVRAFSAQSQSKCPKKRPSCYPRKVLGQGLYFIP